MQRRRHAVEHAAGDSQRVHHAEVAPDAPIRAGHEERHHLRGEHDRQRPREHVEVPQEVPGVLEAQPVRRVVADRHQAEVEQHFGDAALVHELDDDRRQRRAAVTRVVGVLVDADAGQVDREDDHRDQEQTRRPAPTTRAANSADRDAEHAADRAPAATAAPTAAPLRQTDRDQTVRRVIASALGRRAAPTASARRVTSVVSKIGTSSTSTGAGDDRQRLPTCRALGAGVSVSAARLKPDQQAAAVAHEDATPDASCRRGTRRSRRAEWPGTAPRRTCRVPAATGSSSTSSAAPTISAMPAQRPSMLSRRLNALVSADDPEQRQQRVERHRLEPVQAVAESEQRRRERDLGDQLRRRLQRQPIVDEPDGEHQRGRHHEHRDVLREPEQRGAAEHDSRNRDSAEEGDRTAMPAIVPGAGDEAEPEGGAPAQRHEHQRQGHRQKERDPDRRQHEGGRIVPEGATHKNQASCATEAAFQQHVHGVQPVDPSNLLALVQRRG